MSLFKLASAEIIRFHQMIEEWFRGTNPQLTVKMLFDRFDKCFPLITPDTHILTLEDLSGSWIHSKRGAFPTHKEKIEDIKISFENGSIIVVNYKEIQTRNNQSNYRYATAVMARDMENLNSVNWVIQHEGWINPKKLKEQTQISP